MTAALRDRLRAGEKVPRGQEAWRRSFGTIDPTHLQEIDEVIEEELETIDLESWR